VPSNYDLGTATGRVEIDYNGRGVDQAEAGLGRLDRAANTTGRSVGASAKAFDQAANVSLVAGGTIAAGLAVSYMTATDFEFQMSAIQAVSGATAEEMGLINKAALRIGKDTAFGATEAAQAMEELVKAGISVDDVLNGAADATVALAAAGGVDLPTAATIAANAMNQFGLAAADLVGVTDTIAGAANASAIDMNQFAYSMSQVGAVANLAGLSFDDTALAIAEMGNAGIVGSDAGTSLKTMLLNLIPSTKKQTTAMSDLGLITEDGTNRFYDQEGRLKSLRDIQEILGKSLEGLTEKQKQMALEAIFGSDAIRGAAVLAGEGAAGFDKMSEAINKVSAADVAATRLENFSGSIEQLKGGLETLAIQVGQLLLPALTSIVIGLTNFMDVVLEAPEGLLKTAVAAAGIGAALLIAFGIITKVTTGLLEFRKSVLEANAATAIFGSGGAIASMITGLKQMVVGLTGGTIAAGVQTGALYTLGAALRGAAAAAFLFAKGLLANPIVRIISIVLALVGAVVALTGGWEEVGRIFKPVGEKLVEAFKRVMKALEPVGDLFTETGKTLTASLAPVLKRLAETLLPPLVAVLEGVAAVLVPVIDLVLALVEPLLGALAPVLKVVATLFGALLVALLPIVELLVNILVPILTGVAWVLEQVATAITWLAEKAKKAFEEDIPKAIEKVWPVVQDLYEKHIKPTVDKVVEKWEELKKKFGPVIDWIVNTGIPSFKQGLSDLKTTAEETLGKVGELWDDVKTKAQPVIDWFVANIMPVLGAQFENLKKVVGTVGSGIKTGLEEASKGFPTLKEKAQPVVDWIANNMAPILIGQFENLQRVVQTFKDIVGRAWSAIRTVVEPVFNWLKDEVITTLQGQYQNLQKVIEFFRDVFVGAWITIQSKVEPVKTWFTRAVAEIGSAFQGTKEKMDELKRKLMEAWQQIQQAVQPIIDKFKNDILPGLKGAIDDVKESMEGVKKKFAEAWASIQEAVQPVIDKLKPLIDELVKKFDELFGNGESKNKGMGGAKKAAEDTKSGIDPLIVALSILSNAVMIVIGFINALVNGLIFLVDTFTFVLGGITLFATLLGTLISGVVQTVIGLFTGLGMTIAGIWQGIQQAIQIAVQLVTAFITGDWGKLPALVGQFFQNVWQTISTAWENIKRTVSTAVQNVKDTIGRVFGQLPADVQAKLGAIGMIIAQPFISALATIQTIPSRIAGIFSGLGTLLVDAGRNLIGGLIRGVESQIGALKSTLSNLTALIPQVKGPPKKDAVLLQPAGELIMNGLINGIESRIGPLRHLLGDITTAIPESVVYTSAPSGYDSSRESTPAVSKNKSVTNTFNVTTDDNPRLWARAVAREYEDESTGTGR
jgi:TP901 family phage tail tape measure protein